MEPIPINFVVEDQLSEAVLIRILLSSGRSYKIGTCYGKQGRSYIEKKVNNFNQAAKGTPYLVLADLDTDVCPPELITHWLSAPKHHNLLFHIAVKEVESWVLADRAGLANFLGVRKQKIPVEVDKIDHAKDFLINLTKKSRNRLIREDIVPRTGSTAKIGPNYNGRLISFVEKKWDIQSASINSESLRRMVERVKGFTPRWATPTQ